MDILVKALTREVPQLKRDGVRLFAGSREGFPTVSVPELTAAEQATETNTTLELNVRFQLWRSVGHCECCETGGGLWRFID